MHALCPGPTSRDASAAAGADALAAAGADVVVVLDGSPVAEDVADAVAALRARDGAVGRARSQHRLRPRGGRPRRGGHRLGTGG